MEGKFIIIDLRDMDFMTDKDGNMKFFDNLDEAYLTCGMYEFENAWICKLIHNHIEEEVEERRHSERKRLGWE